MPTVYDPNHLQYCILPGRVTKPTPGFDLHAETYRFWKKFWLDEMAISGGDKKYVSADDFLRQTEILIVTAKSQIVAMVMSSLYDLSSPASREAKYFEKLDETMFQEICKTGTLVNTIEFLMVNRDWRGSRPGAQMSAVMIGLVLRRARTLGAQASVGMPRVDNRVNITSHDFGAVSLGRVAKVSIECEVVAFYPESITPHPRPAVNELIDRLSQGLVEFQNLNPAKVNAA